MAKNKLRMGVIGLGMGYGHAKGFYAHPAAELVALWLMGYPEPVAVSGSTYDHIAQQEQQDYNVEDLACGLIKFANGATLVLEASWALNIAERERMYTELYGTKGSLSQYNVKGGYEFIGEVFTHEGDSFFNKTLEDRVAPTPSAFTEFIDSIVDQRLPLATGVEGIKLMKILAGIYKSAETGKEVRYKM